MRSAKLLLVPQVFYLGTLLEYLESLVVLTIFTTRLRTIASRSKILQRRELKLTRLIGSRAELAAKTTEGAMPPNIALHSSLDSARLALSLQATCVKCV